MDGRHILTTAWDGSVRFWDVSSGLEAQKLGEHSSGVTSAMFSPIGSHVLTSNADHTIGLWDLSTNRELLRLRGGSESINSVAFSPDGSIFASGGSDGQLRLWDQKTGQLLASLVSLKNGDWAVIRENGPFDSSRIEEAPGIHWVFPEEPFRALRPEVFMRDYYEPRLLSRLLAGEKLKPVRPLASLNRTQPWIGEPEVVPEPGGGGLVTVRVRAKNQRSEVQKDASGKLRQSGVYDVRLFRDGQLVRWAPRSSTEWQARSSERGNEPDGVDLAGWRQAHEVKAGQPEVERVEADGTLVVRFSHIQLPRRPEKKQATFTAYAFNEDRVKSATATKAVDVPAGLTPRQGRAYVISIGVNRTRSTPAWNLQYAANDARRMNAVVSERLGSTKVGGANQFGSVVPIRLVSDAGGLQEGELPATQASLRAVLDVLAGRTKPDSRLQKLGLQEKAQPEDLVLISVSSHGYTDDRGTFHFVLADVTAPQKVNETLNRQTLSSDQLSAWLREVDAGELVMIVDACQSETTIQTEGFKPGPMGSRGLGQLAYDKGMRVLAASKAKESAFELGQDAQGHKIEQGLLSYALVQEGLVQKQADTDHNGVLTMGEWLRYAEQEVPKLFQQGYARGGVQRKGAPGNTLDRYLGKRQGDVGGENSDTPARYQQPTLFDFNKTRQETVLTEK